MSGDLFLTANSTSADSGQGLYFQSTTSGWTTSSAHAAIFGKRTDASNGYLRFDTRQSGTTQEAMRIDSSGRVGIGVSPAAPLDVMVAGANQWYIRNSDNSAQNNAIVSLRSGGYSNIALDGATVDLKIGGSSKFHVDASGNVGIGQPNPDAVLHVTDGNNHAKFGDFHSNSTIALRMSDNATQPVEIHAYSNELRFNTCLLYTSDAADE